MSFAGHDYYTELLHPPKQKEPATLDGISLDQFDGVVKNASITNEQRIANAVSSADSQAFWQANPWLKNTAANKKIIDRFLKAKGLFENTTYPDLVDVTTELASTGLLDVDEAAYAQHLDGNGPKKFKGHYTGREFTELESLIAQERDAAIKALSRDTQSDFENVFERLPIEDAQQLLRDAEKQTIANENAKISQTNADSWLSLHPEWKDSTINGKLMLAQMRLNGFVPPYTIEQYEICERQLVADNAVQLIPAQVQKQQAQAVLDRAKRAVETPGSVFDKTTEEEMYALPLDEVRRRAAGNYTGIDRL
jgi:hypothetical protein